MKQYLVGAILYISIALLLIGCSNADKLTFSQLTAQPDNYNDKVVTIEAFYFDAFEMMALCNSLVPSESVPNHLVPQGTLIWLDGGLPPEIHNKLYTQSFDNASGYPEHLGKIKITGKFQSRGNYGHLGGYQYQISISEVELLNWAPPADK